MNVVSSPVIMPVPFAPGVIATGEAGENALTFAPDGRMALFTRYEDDWQAQRGYFARWRDGAWREPERLDAIGPDDLKLREGCAVVLRGRGGDGSFVGSTVGDACKSTLRGASYATSEVSVTSGGITSWDRGYSADDEQVWGAKKGPYVFERKL